MSESSLNKINFLNFDRPGLRDFFIQLNEKPFHADQVIQWVHTYGHDTFDGMTNLSKNLRLYLTEHAVVVPPKIVLERISKDETRKWLLELEDGEKIEMVYIPEESRGTLCISSQVGCPLKCTFCATGQQGFKRNLTLAEIIGQLWLAVRLLSTNNKEHDHHVTNVVFMGMGEPLLNLDNVVKAANLMLNHFAYGLSKYRVTISTAGIVPAMDQLADLTPAALAISLHATNDELRNQLMPINKTYPLKELMGACKRFSQKYPDRKLSFEYLLIDHVNDEPKHAKELIKLLSHIPSKVNLIPYNTTSATSAYQKSASERVLNFQDILAKAGLRTMIRKTRGGDIEAACGQLKGKKENNALKTLA